MFETVAWISIIIGFVAVISISLAAMLIMRRREQNAPPSVDSGEAVRKVDATADAVINEINKTAELVLKDIDEKYQTLLFLYDLLEDKQKKISAAGALTMPSAARASSAIERGFTSAASVSKLYARQPRKTEAAETTARKPMPVSARHEKIISLYREGIPSADIAKELNIGSGEVKLIIDLMERG